MDVHEYLGVLRRGIVLILLGVLLGVGGGLVARSMETPAYAATSRDLVTNRTSGDLTEWLQAGDFTEQRIASYVLVASSGLVLQPVIDELGLDSTVEDLARQITVTAPPATFIIEITATAPTPELARDIANAVSAQFGEVVATQLETPGGTAATPAPGASATPSPSTTKLPNGNVVPITQPVAPVRIVNIEEAVLPTAPLPSNGILILIVGGVVGLTLGLIAASLREAFDRRVRGPKDVVAIARIGVVGDIPADRTVPAAPLVAHPGSSTRIAESFRTLRAHLDHLRARDGRRSFVVTAAGPGQGATTVTANLAVAVAGTATSVVVVDADLRSSALSRLFGIHGAPGLTEVLAGHAILDAALRSGVAGGVTVLPAGSRPSNPGELLASAGMRELLAELRRRYDVVLVDTPSIATVTDAAVLGALDSATLLVLAQGTTTRPRLEEALAQLGSGGSTPVGVVLTSLPRRGVFGRRAPRAGVRHDASAPVFTPAAVQVPAAVSVPVAQPVAVPEPGEVAAPTPAPVPRAPQQESEAPAAVGPAARAPKAEPPAVPATPAKRKTASHLAAPLPEAPVAASPAPAPRAAGPRRASAPAGASAPVVESTPVVESAAVVESTPVVAPVETPRPQPKSQSANKPKPTPRPAAPEPAPASAVTEIEHTIGTARDLDFAFAALPTATAAEQRAGALSREIDDSTPQPIEPAKLVERPIVIKPDPPRPSSRFAPDPTRFAPKLTGAYANAPAPEAGTEGKLPPTPVNGTVVNTVSIRVQRDEIEAATVPPPIRHILPRPTASTIPPKAVEAARAAPEPEPEPQLVELRPRTGPVPVRREAPLPPADDDRTRAQPIVSGSPYVDDEPTAETAAEAPDAVETRAMPVAGSLLGEIGGLPRVEVRTARPAAINDTAPNPEREARESYELRARELERVAHERLMREQQRLAVNIREQLAHDKRELESVLDNRLEDTVLRPRDLDAD